MATLVQRKKHGTDGGPKSPTAHDMNGIGGDDPQVFLADTDGFSDKDMQTRRVKLTLLEEVLLLGLKDEQGYLSFWNDNISYVLRACILMELSMRQRITVFKEPAGRHHRKPYIDRLVDVCDDSPTGEMLLDEALKLMKQHQQTQQRQSVGEWVDLLSGETWNLLKISYQLKQVRERLAKGLVDKGVCRNEKKNFLLFEMPTHPIQDPQVKDEIINRLADCLLARGGAPTRRTIALCCAAYAANVMDNALNAVGRISSAPQHPDHHLQQQQLTYSQKDQCFAKCEDMLIEWSGGNQQFNNNQLPSSPTQGSQDSGINSLSDRERIGWTDVMSGAVAVFLKMDSML